MFIVQDDFAEKEMIQNEIISMTHTFTYRNNRISQSEITFRILRKQKVEKLLIVRLNSSFTGILLRILIVDCIWIIQPLCRNDTKS